MMPDDAYRSSLVIIAEELFDGMMEYQDADTGMWYNVVNLDGSLSGNKLESSGSALMAYAMMKLYTDGYVGHKYGEAGLKAFNGTVAKKMTSDNRLTDVYRSSGVETTDAGYLQSTYETDEAKGVGPLIMASCYANAAAEKYNAALKKYTGRRRKRCYSECGIYDYKSRNESCNCGDRRLDLWKGSERTDLYRCIWGRHGSLQLQQC